MTSPEVLAVDMSDAPPHILKEIEALNSGGVHSFREFEGLSDEAKLYLKAKAKDSTDVLTKMMVHRYTDTINLIEIGVLGIEAMAHVTGDKIAKDLNLKLYNACAAFVRAYNTKDLDS